MSDADICLSMDITATDGTKTAYAVVLCAIFYVLLLGVICYSNYYIVYKNKLWTIPLIVIFYSLATAVAVCRIIAQCLNARVYFNED